MAKLLLSRPALDLKDEYLDFYYEWKESGETMVPWVIEKDPTDFEEMVQSLLESEKGTNLPEGWVPDSTFWLINEDRNVLGAVNIRHELTPRLLDRGGHIGYGIRPSERKKGYATEILKLSLEKAKEFGIQKALVTCNSTNIGSLKTITKNGGVPDEDFIEEDGNVIKRFWIQI